MFYCTFQSNLAELVILYFKSKDDLVHTLDANAVCE
jgi:hypothetical protein